ncbi:NADH-quinone oxidoreductase subunit L [Buchnera aphidicola]|jgi:NADH-quinone oxidoreductase subunit L|uniref:NADH-quinone oxidoreductase subunit L n=1 Tax=Buchnera aphidicola subsp. Schizaphis graminum (strain Sg) TaxID=198804 RepID=NUOL_BUCAP|nr:NADH-quinone oxidoreductase subunit L [Buchnera aphidicola]Q8K9X7.1 RecName: Full=NADH-quinone oxidoreductase subunit L; AltName: Full=NADH dehydrogenase I subunit L; AltName: Full=NDH-1 subunit L [Buchnera aphidicola str. Sg (Schizaphis graminum)]AAM67725.1 NADH dehydrogenase I chain L [Buchnera aphidicola str. Sg (Schizaphis graminum)]AWI49779.1 NADH-quinone oxidoreductase subunit L [Buchnera aphidicola (Schizaphis graminum)]
MNIIFLIILFPLIGFLFLSLIQGTISERNTNIIGISSIFVSLIITFFYITGFINYSSQIFTQKLFSWISINELDIDCSLILDGLSLSMLAMILGIGLLIHIFSTWYMKDKEGYSRFFAYTNLFIASMSLLVLADNFLFMYLGWEIVSICSYLLIGFYYKTTNNTSCALKAFVFTRISDVFLIISMFLIYNKYGTFNFQEIKFLSNFLNVEDCFDLNVLTLCLLLGVMGKSAQLPLHTWLSDAMVGPTPVSALIHAATMVTAGVYLIARTHFLFLLTPKILYLISLIGIITIFISSFSALVQQDIKRILAYSTMSQIGYMFLALGVKAWTAAIVHLIVHAIFKALLFLSSGSLILSCNNEKNIFNLSKVSSKCPLLYVSFLVGGASLVSFPLITSGFYSKGNILFSVLKDGYFNLFLIGLFCSFLTSIYTFRMIFVIFHRSSVSFVFSNKRLAHNLPLLILLFFSTMFGYFIIRLPLFYVFPMVKSLENGKFLYEIISSFISFLGIFIAYHIWIKQPFWFFRFLKFKIIKLIHKFLLNGWYFDFFYKILFIHPYLFISKILSYEPFDFFPTFFVAFIKKTNSIVLKSVNGNVKCYISTMFVGINLFFILVLCSFLS